MDIQMYALRQDRPLRADERERLRAGLPQSIRFKPARKAAVKRDASLCAYAVLRAALYDLCGWETLPDMAYSERGKPYFPAYPGVHFSLSHSYGCILVGVHDRPLGVDIERFRPVRAERLRRVLGAETEEDFWQRWTDRCLSCGACTYFCPTCYCFTITDEGEGLSEKGGRRLRSWDNCMSPLFTREASGHNPRTAKALRMRNRVSHKYWYAPDYSDGRFACTGCGRCIKQCPVSLDIREIVLNAIADDAEAK